MSGGFSYQQYLAAKKTVDDRALNAKVLAGFQELLTEKAPSAPVKILEIGAGIGTMAERILEPENTPPLEYTVLDLDPESIEIAFARLEQYLDDHGWKTTLSAIDEKIRAQKNHRSLEIRFRTADALEFTTHEAHRGRYDVLLAHAVLDIFHIESALPALLQTLTSGGLYYFTLNYNGRTTFHPPIDQELGTLIEARYNASMDRIRVAGNSRSGSRTGDHLLAFLERETELLLYGDSDWEVRPTENSYRYEEEFFVRCILKTMEHALSGDPVLDQSAFQKWLVTRYQALEEGTLTFKAHNMDFCGQLPAY